MPTRLALIAFIPLAACAHTASDVSASYASTLDTPSGSIEIALNSPSQALTIAVNDHVLVDRKNTRKALINGVPAGPAHVVVSVGAQCEQNHMYERDLNLVPGVTAQLALPGPEVGEGCATLAGAEHIGLQIGWVAAILAWLPLVL
ncbi:MAG TPA: hypothetical protein VGM90_06495 [Kofleriaceae bacterium]|jgi:hypothetical protein